MGFQGAVTFEAHGGMLKSTLSELALEAGEDGLVLTVLDAPMNKTVVLLLSWNCLRSLVTL